MTAAGIRRTIRRLLPRRARPTQRVALVLAIATLVTGTTLSIMQNNAQVKVASVIIIVIVLSSLMLSTNGMLILLATVAICLIVVFSVHGLTSTQLSPAGFVMVLVTGLVGIAQARRRDALGLKEISAETVIGLIRERLLVQSQLPSVPDGWTVEIEQRPADGAAISGDFVSTRLVCEGAEPDPAPGPDRRLGQRDHRRAAGIAAVRRGRWLARFGRAGRLSSGSQ